MADLDEDAALSPFHSHSHEDNDPDDGTADFRFLAALNAKSNQLPKRGEKDFEPHGTKHQDSILAASRQAMHDVLDYTRIHTSRQDNRGFYYGDESMDRDDVIPEAWRQGLEEDHVVVLEASKGPLFKTMGKMSTGIKNPALWLLPEEALFMVERGNLDLWWPSRSSFEGIMRSKRDEDDEEEEKSKGTPMSLQAAYAMFIGNDGEQGKVSLERYTVYAHLKRNGWVALRAPDWNPDRPGLERRNQNIISPHEPRSIFTWLFGRFFAEKDIKHPAYGPLVRPGMHRSYNTIYRQVAIIPRHKPSSIAAAPAPAREDPYRVIFHLWKPTTIANFTKSNPGIPDYRVAVVDARSNPIPTLSQITSLLESTPWDPPQSELEGPGDKKLYGRLRHGWRNVILAVIDEGVISYVELGEAAFGEERLYENFDRGNLGGSKRGGRGGRGRGKGRGRARGRG